MFIHPAPLNRGLNQGCCEKFMTNFTDLDTQMKCCEVEILLDFSHDGVCYLFRKTPFFKSAGRFILLIHQYQGVL